ncbi:hypothetical protein PpBr36_05212 [Pyricularia pennisetigena]|uniref:hypothetical protein n=1 Tax=Pyricularia pennisetigena TaxID=1578925 RepID=UPI00114FC6F5|nr:hypothetical protein PpBr36_05212 [Pyricularia pennisetigena]TLS27642.1 hypothetical protein PpBr36_05212 [Pyricularia pennisetigena]
MSLYHEAAAILTHPEGGSLKSRVFGAKNLKSPPAQVYALVLETCKWSAILKEVVDSSQLLNHERRLTPPLAILLAHDLLLAKGGVALPASHGLRVTIERHKARLSSELTRARIRRKAPTLDALRAQVDEATSSEAGHPRWVRVNTLRSSLAEQLETTFFRFSKVDSVLDVVTKGAGGGAGSSANRIYLDEHVPNLVAISPGSDITKTEAYKSGAIILQDKASCFPAYLLDPRPQDGDVIDACAAPGNKTTHAAAVLEEYRAAAGVKESKGFRPTVHAFEKDSRRAEILAKMVKIAGSDSFTVVNKGKDFLKADPNSPLYKDVGALLLDPSCSGSGIVGRDDAPELHLPEASGSANKGQSRDNAKGGKRKRQDEQDRKSKKNKANDQDGEQEEAGRTFVDDDGQTTMASSAADLAARLAALSSFQATLLEHAMKFPSAKRITYSTCSIHAEENEGVVVRTLRRNPGWRIMTREEQVDGMRKWPVRGEVQFCEGDKEVAEGCIRAYKGDGHGVMGFFVAAFVPNEDGQAMTAAPTVATPEARNDMMDQDNDSDDSEWGGCSD